MDSPGPSADDGERLPSWDITAGASSGGAGDPLGVREVMIADPMPTGTALGQAAVAAMRTRTRRTPDYPVGAGGAWSTTGGS